MNNQTNKINNNQSDYINYIHACYKHTIRKSYHIKYERQGLRDILDSQIMTSIKAATPTYNILIGELSERQGWIINHVNNTSVCIVINRHENNNNAFFIHAKTVLNKTNIFYDSNDFIINIRNK
jgi:hypothetical protein